MSNSPQTGYSMPLLAEEYPPPPYRFTRIEGANLLCRTDAAVTRELIPPPLTPQPDNKVWLYAVELKMEEPRPLQYREVGIFLPVIHGDSPGLYALVLFLDQALPITVGREIWGFPKRAADCITVSRHNHRVTAELALHGRSILNWSFAVSGDPPPNVPPQNHRVFTRRVIPSPDATSGPAVDELVQLGWSTQPEARSRGTDVAFQADWSWAPRLAALQEMQVLAAWYSDSLGCTLESGRRVHNYLEA